MLNLTFNLFSLLMLVCVLVCVWILLPEKAKIAVQKFVFKLWRRVVVEYKALGKRAEDIRREHHE